jgi:hypothetical protein
MAHIALPEGIPGIVGPMMQYPETAAPLNALAEVLLRGPSSLSKAERELIAAYVSNATIARSAAARMRPSRAISMAECSSRWWSRCSPKWTQHPWMSGSRRCS